MTIVRVIALGSLMGRDDGAALVAARAVEGDPGVEVFFAGRPGPGLLDLLVPDRPALVLDVIRRGAAPGRIVELDLAALVDAAVAGDTLSSHGLGVANALRLGAALGRALPEGRFVGIGGVRFDPGDALTPDVAAGIEAMVTAARGAIAELAKKETSCTSTA